jgi:hypothetical protein
MSKPGPDRRDPKSVGELRIAGGDVSSQPEIVSLLSENPVRGGKPALSMLSLGLERGSRSIVANLKVDRTGRLAHKSILEVQ